MRVQRFYFLVALLGILCSCSENNSTDFVSETINSNQGISTDTLRFVYSGPQDFNLDYFPETAIHAAKVKECTIIQQDSTSTRVARRVQFDRAGNTINDENRFFFLWFAGTMRGVYHYQYNTAGKLIKMVGIYEEDSKDSVMTVTNYNTQGLLYSEDDYHFAKQLKPGADGHLPSKNDYEEHPTWNKEKTRQFLFRVDTAIIETFVDDKIVNTEKYQLLFDSVKRLRTVNEFQNGFLKEKRDYAYEPNNITEFLIRQWNDGKTWAYKSKAIFNDRGEQIEKILLNDDSSEKVKMTVIYNENHTIKRIKYQNTIQEFKYAYY